MPDLIDVVHGKPMAATSSTMCPCCGNTLSKQDFDAGIAICGSCQYEAQAGPFDYED